MEHREAEAVFKFPITSPSINRSSTKVLARKNIFNLPAVIEHTNQRLGGTRSGKTARGKRQDRGIKGGLWKCSSTSSEED